MKTLGEEVLEHWTRIVACKTKTDVMKEGTGVTSCAFCREYYDYGCKGCPVYEDTGQTLCNGTPYDAVLQTLYEEKRLPTKEAKAQLAYLTNLIKPMKADLSIFDADTVTRINEVQQ
jgi:hypothetical protein